MAVAHGQFIGIRQVAHHLIHASVGQPESKSQTVSRSVQPFLHSSRQSLPILYNGPLFPAQNGSFPCGDLDPI